MAAQTLTQAVAQGHLPSTLGSSRDNTGRGEYDGNASNHIAFLHPGYNDPNKHSVLLRLQAFDREGGGLHFGLARTACCIVAGNSKRGYLTHERDGPPIELQYDELLREKQYYFYNPDFANEIYPVYKSFADWSFPHDDFPLEWSLMIEDSAQYSAPPAASQQTAFLRQRDGCCRISELKGSDYWQSAHCIPRSERDWFVASGMEEYNLNNRLQGDSMIDDVRNAFLLRSDIHSAFDESKFVVVPKQSKWVVQFLGVTNGLGNEFHNTHIHLTGVSPQFLYARLAWTLFPLLSPFLGRQVSRQLIVRLSGGEESSREFTYKEIQASFATRSRSVSPRKRHASNVKEGAAAITRNCREGDGSASEVEDLEFATSLPGASSSESASRPILDREYWIRKQRPTDSSLYCCDYKKAEADARAGLPGNPKWGGAYLCDLCLGVEYLEDRDKDVEIVAWGDP